MRTILLLVLVLLALPMASRGATPYRDIFAVVELNVEGHAVTDQDGAAMTDQLRAAAVRVAGRQLTIMTRENMEALLPPGTNLRCFAGACLATIGQKLQARYVMGGTVRKVGSRLELTVETYDSKTKALLGSHVFLEKNVDKLVDAITEKAPGLLRSWLPIAQGPGSAAVPAMADQTINASEDLGAAASNLALVKFTSDPAGAVLELDGQLLCQSTPCSRNVEAGTHEVAMQKEQYVSTTKTMDLTSGQEVSMTLAPTFALLSVETTPSGLTISVNGRDIGQSPISGKKLDPGVYKVLVDDPCWLPNGEQFSVQKGEDKTARIEGKPRMGFVQVTAQDSDGNAVAADVSVDGKDVGTAPGTFRVSACAKEMELSTQDGRTKDVALNVEERKTVTVNVVLPASAVASNSSDSGANTSSGDTFRAADLEWQKQPSRQLDLPDAKAHCARLSLAGGGWRLPSMGELLALCRAKLSAAEIAGYPGMGQSSNDTYWSATPSGSMGSAYGVDLQRCTAYDETIMGFGWASVRCVRGSGAPAAGTFRAAAPPSPPPPTFSVAGHEWQKVPAADEMDWEDAKAYCANLSLAGGGWRLPTIGELVALYQSESSGVVAAGLYWSSTDYSWPAFLSANAWFIDFHSGAVGKADAEHYKGNGMTYAGAKDYKDLVRCVR